MITEERFQAGWTWDQFLSRVQMHKEEWPANLARDAQVPPDLAEAIINYPHPLKVVALIADWCGDALATTPAIINLLSLNPLIEIRCFPRDENLDVMDLYLTNGGRAIPKFVIFDASMNELAQWGARPTGAQKVASQAKAEGDTVKEYWPKVLAWYRSNHPFVTWREWSALFEKLPR